MFGIINKLKSAACISDEYHNNLGVKMSINIDRMVKKFKDHETSIKKIAETELIKIYSKIKSSKDVFNGSEVMVTTIAENVSIMIGKQRILYPVLKYTRDFIQINW